jgi:predicted cupin superfamily sugar epimerase
MGRASVNGYNFTERVRRILAMSREEAASLYHEFVGPEHMLVGLLRENEGVGAAALRQLNIDFDDARRRIESVIPKGLRPARGDLPFTSRAKKSLEYAMAEARRMNHTYVGSEHLLLGLLLEGKNIAAATLQEMGATHEKVLECVSEILSRGTDEKPRTPGREKTDDPMIQRLGLMPHPEGGHYRELYRSAMGVSAGGRERRALTTIYYYLRKSELSRWHVVQSDEIWHAYAATNFQLLHYDPFGKVLRTLTFGANGDPDGWVHVIPAGHWQAGVAHDSALMGCTVAPGFEFADFKLVRDIVGHESEFVGAMAEWRRLL